ncbi:hypothetical protein ACSSS7_002775 [Eimeria intestinalis]
MEQRSETLEDAPKPFTVAISGSHGLIGSYLMQLMKVTKEKPPSPSAEGAEGEARSSSACVYTTGVPEDYAEEDILWAPKENWIEGHKLEGLDAVIHLAGEPVAEKGEVAGDPAGIATEEVEGEPAWGLGRKLFENEWMRALGSWNAAKMTEIHDSRVRTTLLLACAFSALKNPPKRFFVASGVSQWKVDSISKNGTSSPPATAQHLEAVARAARKLAPVLSLKGGMLPRMRAVSEMRVGSRYGDGRQWMSWVSLLDACKAILFLLGTPSVEARQQHKAPVNDEIRLVHPKLRVGPVNICSPEPVRNSEFCAALKEVTLPNAWFYLPIPVPASVLRLALGQLADELLLNGQRGTPQKLESQGFVFTHSELLPALQWCWAEGTGARQGDASFGSKPQNKRNPRSSMEKGPRRKQLVLTSHSAALSGYGLSSFKLASDLRQSN